MLPVPTGLLSESNEIKHIKHFECLPTPQPSALQLQYSAAVHSITKLSRMFSVRFFSVLLAQKSSMGLVQYGGVRIVTLIELDPLSLKTSLALPWGTGTQDGSLCAQHRQ